MDLNRLANLVHQNACDKGWHPENESEDEFIGCMCNNLHDEVSELHEAWRNNKLHEQCDKPISLTCLEEEIADIIIRVLDNAVELGIDPYRVVDTKHEYNKTRPHRHGGKRS